MVQFRHCSLERNNKGFGSDFLEHDLDGFVIQLEDVLEDKHLVHDLLGQVGVVPTDGLEHHGIHVAAQQIDDFCGRLDTVEVARWSGLGGGR